MKKTDSMLAPQLGEQCLRCGQWGVSDLLVMANFLIGVIVTQMLFFVNICQFLHLQFLLFVYVYYIELNISLKIIKKTKNKKRGLQGTSRQLGVLSLRSQSEQEWFYTVNHSILWRCWETLASFLLWAQQQQHENKKQQHPSQNRTRGTSVTDRSLGVVASWVTS